MKSLQATNTSKPPAVAATSGTKSSATQPKQLPKTASSLPLMALFGLASLTLGVGTGALRRRVQ